MGILDAVDRTFEKFVDAIMDSDGVATRWDNLTRVLVDIGIDQVNYAFLDTAAAERMNAPVRFLSTMRPEWIQYYGDNRLDIRDPHVRFLRNGNMKAYVWTHKDNEKLENPDERETVFTAVDEGLNCHMQVTLPDSEGNSALPVAGMLLGSSLKERDFRGTIKGLESKLITMAYLFHNRSLGEMKRMSHEARRLSVRERDCLTYLTRGLRIDAIAAKLNLSRPTVELHLSNARRKLKATTIHEAIAKAIRWQEI